MNKYIISLGLWTFLNSCSENTSQVTQKTQPQKNHPSQAVSSFQSSSFQEISSKISQESSSALENTSSSSHLSQQSSTSKVYSLSLLSQVAPSGFFKTDKFLPLSEYKENYPDPKNSGKYHLILQAPHTGSFESLTIENREASLSLEEGKLDWYHVWPRQFQEGEIITISFHSQEDALYAKTNLNIEIKTNHGIIKENVPISHSPEYLSYITTSQNKTHMVIHIQNPNHAPLKIKSLQFVGFEIKIEKDLPPRDSLYFEIPLGKTLPQGSAWWVRLLGTNLENGQEISHTAIGRVLPEFFPIEAWVGTSDCPFPEFNEENWKHHQEAGIDTFFIHNGSGGCQKSTGTAAMEALVKNKAWSILDRSVEDRVYSQEKDRVAARKIGDEADTKKDTRQATREKLALAFKFLAKEPEIPTYIGGSVNRNIGKFAGLTDIQGMDFYIGACAPHITEFLSGLKLRQSYDYARITQENHAPLPTWIYAQGFSDVWNAKIPVLNTTVYRQPEAHELLIQAMSTLAAGAKGIMWFQTKTKEAFATDAYRKSWKAMGEFNQFIQKHKEFLRLSHPIQGTSSSTDKILAVTLRGPQTLLVTLINMNATYEPNDLKCGAGQNEHWRLGEAKGDIKIMLPSSMNITQKEGSLPFEMTKSGNEITLSQITLNEENPIAWIFLKEE